MIRKTSFLGAANGTERSRRANGHSWHGEIGAATSAALTFLLLGSGSAALSVSPSSVIRSVSVSRPFFNPTIGQKIDIRLSLESAGSLSAFVLDRDGFVVRALSSARQVDRGPVSLHWDGRDDESRIVPDEAYSLKIDFSSGTRRETYFPGNAPGEKVKVGTNYYDRRAGVLSYQLVRPARVHVQAGIAALDPKTGKRDGPVLKTVANREPRPAGSVVENWNGFDESGSVHVPMLSNFVIAIAATALPENAILTTGNHSQGFLERALKRQGKTLFTFAAADHHHHRGLAALDDVAPRLRLRPLTAIWSPSERSWRMKTRTLKVAIDLEGPSSDYFAKQPGELVVFVDHIRVKEVVKPSRDQRIELEIPRGSVEPRIIAFNWASSYGPVAASTLRVSGPARRRSTVSPRGMP